MEFKRRRPPGRWRAGPDGASEMRFAVFAHRGVGVALLRRLDEHGLRPAVVVTNHPMDVPPGAGPRRRLRHRLNALRHDLAGWLPGRLGKGDFNTYRYCHDRGWPVISSERLDDDDTRDTLRSLDLDLGLVFTFRVLPPEVLALTRHGFWGVHTAPLPANRGPYPTYWALARGDELVGYTIFSLDEGIDTGPVLLQRAWPRCPDEDSDILTWRLSALAARDMTQLVVRHSLGDSPEATAQVGESDYRQGPSVGDLTISSALSREQVIRRVRAARDRGGAYLEGIDERVIDAFAASTERSGRLSPRLFALRSADGLTVVLVLRSTN